MVMLFLLDVYFINHAYHNTLIKGPSVQLVFGFEYAILLSAVVLIFVKYILHAIDAQSENPWENKAVYLLYTELMVGGVKVALYFLFLAIMIKVHTFPLFAIRPMYLTIREFRKALSDVVMSRRAIRNMNTLYPDATVEEIASGDNVCIICREEMHTQCKKLPCNHIFHTSCLRSWFQRQQTCPTCRMDVLRPPGTTTVPAAAANQGHQPPVAPPFAGPGLPPFVPPQFQPMWQPNLVAPVRAQAPGQQPPSVTEPVSSNGTAPDPSFPTYSHPAGSPQFAVQMPPSFGVPFWFPPPIPLPPPNFSGLTVEELRTMEGNERLAVEARIQCLRDIQTLLNAAMFQLQQYNTVAGPGAGLFSQPSQAGGLQPSIFAQMGRDTVTTNVLSTPHHMATSKAEDVSAVVQKDLTLSAVAESEGATGYTPPKEELIPRWEDLDNTAAAADDDDDDGEIGQIRRRRLQRFSSTNLKSMDES